MVDNSERIDKFLKKQMTPEENKKFLEDLKLDKVLRKEAQMAVLMIQELQERQAKKDAEIIEDILVSKKRTKTISIVRWSLSIAAMFILIFGVMITLWNKQSDADVLYAQADIIFEQHYSPYVLQGEPRGGDSDVEKELSTLFNQIGTEKDVTPVIEKLQKIHDSIDSEYEYSLYADDIVWYLALAYLKGHNLEKAKELLKPLAENGHEEAITLLKAIEAF